MAKCSPELNGQNLLLKTPYTLVARQKSSWNWIGYPTLQGWEVLCTLLGKLSVSIECGSCILQYCQASCIHLYNSGMTVTGVIDYFLNWICGSFHQRKFTFVRNNFVKIPVGRELSMLSEGKPITPVSLPRHFVTLFSFMFTSSD